MDFFWLILFFHVMGATIWTGGHLALSFVVLPRALKARDPKVLTDFENGFEKIGMPALFRNSRTLASVHFVFSHATTIGAVYPKTEQTQPPTSEGAA